MLQAPSLRLLQHQMRQAVCAGCTFRPANDDQTELDAARECERTCPIFVNLATLRARALRIDPMFSHTRAIRAEIAHINHAGVPDGPRGDDPRRTPLREYADRVAKVISDSCDC